MDANRQVDVGTLLQGVASTLMQNKAAINQVDTGPGGGTHGDRVAQAFSAAAQAAQSAKTSDAGGQFAAAAQAMRQQGQGRSATYYANGLQQAANQFSGQTGISANDIGPLLQAFAGGAQQGNPAAPGQGTMLDALLPAASAFMGATQQGMDPKQAAIQALMGAVTGAQRTASPTAPQPGYQGNYSQGGGVMDPGAASATHVLGGIVGTLLPGVLGALTSQSGAAQGQNAGPLGALGGLLGAFGGGQQGSGQVFPGMGTATDANTQQSNPDNFV